MPSLRDARRRRAGEHSTSRDEAVREIEERSSVSTGWPTGAYMSDPSAIPPPSMNQMSRAGVPVTPHTSLQVDAVFTSCRIISNSINRLGNLRAYKDTVSTDGVPFRVWSKTQPDFLTDTFGPDMFQYDGRRRTVMSMALFQEAFWHVVERDDLGYALTVDVLHPSFMKIDVAKDGTKTYTYGPPQDNHVIPAENVVHIPNMTMPGGVRGLATINYGGVTFALALAAMEYGQKWFAQGASPSYVLQTKAKLNQAEIGRIAQKFIFEHSGLANSHLPLVLDQGLEAHKVQAHPDEAQFLETLEFSRQSIAAWFGIPSFLLPPAGQRSNTPEPPGVIQERMMSFLSTTLSGYTIPLEEAHSKLIKNAAGFYDEAFAQPDAKALAAEIQALRLGQVASVNDIRTRKLGWEPSDDPDADKVMLPLASNVAGGKQQWGGTEQPSDHVPPEPEPAPEPAPKKTKS